ncbi:hypothetical protein ACV5Z5_004649 [Salmonella enterica subsp. enterica]
MSEVKESNKKADLWAEILRLREVLGDDVERQDEIERLRNIILDAPDYFRTLTSEQRNEIDDIFNFYFDEENPRTIYKVIGHAAAYVLRGQLNNG